MIHQQSIDWEYFDVCPNNLNRVAEWWGKFFLRAAIQKERKGDPAGKPVQCTAVLVVFVMGDVDVSYTYGSIHLPTQKLGQFEIWSFLLHQSSTFTKRWVFQASPRRIVFVKNSEMNNISAKGFRDLEQMYSSFVRRWSNLPEQRTVLYPASRSECEKRSKIWMQN